MSQRAKPEPPAVARDTVHAGQGAQLGPGDEPSFAGMMAEFDQAAAMLGIPPSEYAILRQPDREVSVSVPLQLDGGGFRVLTGWRVQHNQGLGPFLGPLQVRADLSLDEVRAVAGWMTWECAVLGIPFGGSSGGIPVDPRSLTRGELERAVRRYTAGMLDIIGPERDVFVPDTGTDPLVMAWIMDTISMHARQTENAAVTGKPMGLGGTHLGLEAGARGLIPILELAFERWKIPAGARIVLQGAGRIGGPLARMLHERGYRICGMADERGALWSERGLDVPSLLGQRVENRLISQAQGAFEHLSLDELVGQPCDALLACAVANTIHAHNAASVRARLVVEGAHGPVSPRAVEILREKGVAVVPHILANGGSVVAAYFEWVQNRQGMTWLESDVERRLRRFMAEAWRAVRAVEDERKIDMRRAANVLAVERVARADQLRGIYA